MKSIYQIIVVMVSLCAVTNSVSAVPVPTPDVSVTVKDSKTNEPVQYATVELLNANDSLIVGGITNEKGYINLPTTVTNGKVRIQFIGYKTYETPVTSKDLGTVLLEEDSKQLKEVVVNGKARTVKLDRDIYTITDEQRAGTATARELLGKLNGVVYSPVDKSISINGNSNILVLVDGIEKDQNMAKTLPQDRIDKVEVIKDPVGKYAADGYAAVINIITKKDYSGFDVSAGIYPTFNFSKYHGGDASSLLSGGANVNLTYTHKNLNLYAAWSGNFDNSPTEYEYTRRYGNDLRVETAPMDDNHPNFHEKYRSNNISVGGDYTFKPNNTIAFELNYNTGWDKSNTQYDLTTYMNDVIIGHGQSNTTNRTTTDAVQGTLTYLGKWSKNSNFEGDFRYRHSMPTDNSIFTQGTTNSQSYDSQTENFYRLNLDYTYNFSTKLSLDVAYGLFIDRFNLYQNNTTETQSQVRNRPSAYLSYNPNSQWSMRVGAMVEFYHQTFMGLKQSQTGLLPLADIMYKPSENFSVKAKYTSSPSYPTINWLTTFTTQQDTLTYSVGNPLIKMSNYQEASLEFNFLKYFTINPFYGFNHNAFQQYLWEGNGQYYQTMVNTSEKQYGVNLSFNIPFTKTFSWQAWAQITHRGYKYNDISNSNTLSMFATNFNYSVPKWDASGSLQIAKYIFTGATLQGTHSGGNDWININLQKNFFNKKLSCSLTYLLPVKIGNFITYDRKDVVQSGNYYSLTRGNLDLLRNMLMLSVNFHFNSGKKANIRKSSLDYDNNTKRKNKLGL